MDAQNLIYFAVVLAYVVGVIVYSFVLSRKESRADFVIGGRSFGPVRVAFSLVTSWFSAGGLMYYYTLVATDLPTMLALTASAAIALFTFSFFAKDFHKRAVDKHYITMTEYVTGDLGKFSGAICAIGIPLIFLGYFLFELIASGFLLSELSGLPYLACLIISAGVVGFYLMLGGFKVLINSDFIQALLLFFFFVLLVIVFAEKPEIDFKRFVMDKPGLTTTGLATAFFSFFGGVIYGADTWQRALCARSGQSAKNGLRLASLLYFTVYGSLALLLMGLFTLQPDLTEGGGYHYLIFDYVNPFFGALLLTTLVAAMMSTLDTILFITSQSLSTDIAYLFGKRLERPRFILQIAIFVIVLGGIILAYFIRDIGTLFWFLLSYWVTFVPTVYLFTPQYKPADKSCALTMLVIIAALSILHFLGLYQDYYIAYFFIGGLILPKLINPLFAR